MRFKSSAVPDDPMESGVGRIPGISLEERDGEELSRAVALLENTTLPISNDSNPIQVSAIGWPESDNYQVALVPVRNIDDRLGKNSVASRLAKPIVVLPVTWKELIGRLGARIGSSGSGRKSSIIRFGEVCADFFSMEVRRSEETVALKPMEFKLLKFLVQNAGRVVSRDEILNEVWGYENYPCTRTVDNHILKLRQKLELDPTHPVHFNTVHGVGYKFVLEASQVVPKHRM